MSANNFILCLESATEVCSVAISNGEELLALIETSEGNKHSEWMTNFILEALSVAQIEFSDLSAIAISSGPGSYTGLRVAYSVGKGLAYSLGIPIIEIDTLKSLAIDYLNKNKLDNNSLIIPMIDARRMEVYQKVYNYNLIEIQSLNANILEDSFLDEFVSYDKVICIGNGAIKISSLKVSPDVEKMIQIHPTICSSAALRFEANQKFLAEEFSDVAYCVPQYFKSPNITKSKKPLLD